MRKVSSIFEPTRDGAPYIVAIYDPDGRIVASQGFPTRSGAEAFLQAFMQENAGEFGLPTGLQAAPRDAE
ncbi:MAG TPA: hypothetical protein VH743_05650 [Beijerinckiaceae bacterium]|jgi:hypothetical protein